ncbi:tol-pal system-associated acyl-CoA thioesterase [Hydromonas duriensis]|uniref:Acyl-CoA thioester hydrolase n=1 Tax=Hydromonas duriensis TaxID=1527608 RepID=A0A4R6YBQ0_9BURK|nr:tol-pal system-associated acyl-CoA thioesterase [Hydromonas duriensis]TDR32988.1 acyl-CoA thioester hydrolase [Hydromonas duriensis]
MSNPVYHLPIKLYFEDTDALGIVYHANYLKYFERARTEWFRSAGIQHMALARDTGVGFVIRQCEMEWFSPLTLDDEVVATAQVYKMGRSSVHLEQNILKNDEVVCRARILMVCVDFQTKKPKSVPDSLRQVFETQVAGV